MSNTEVNQETGKVICSCGATSSETHQDTCPKYREIGQTILKKLGK